VSVKRGIIATDGDWGGRTGGREPEIDGDVAIAVLRSHAVITDARAVIAAARRKKTPEINHQSGQLVLLTGEAQ